jgi:hypothetical protein
MSGRTWNSLPVKTRREPDSRISSWVTTTVAPLLIAAGAGTLMWLMFRYVISDPRLTLEYVRALAWPLVVLSALFWAREPLLRKFEELLRLEGFGASAEFSAARQSQRLEADIRGDVDTLLDAQTPPADPSDEEAAALADPLDDVIDRTDQRVEQTPRDDPPTTSSAPPSARRDLETRDSIESVIRKSAAWGYEVGSAGASFAAPDVEWEPDGSWRITTEVPARIEPRKSTAQRNRLRQIKDLEDEIKDLERQRYSSASLSRSVQDLGWIMEMKRRLADLDPGNPWAQDRF